MGTDKALLPHPRGGSWLDHAIDLLSTTCGRVIVSGRQQPAAAPRNNAVAWLPDQHPQRGPAGGVATVLRYLTSPESQAFCPDADAVLLIPLDMPTLQAAHLRRLQVAWEAAPDRVFAASFDGHFAEPLLAIYPKRFADQLETLANSSDRSLSRWLRQQQPQRISISPSEIPNLNTASQWEAFRRTRS